MILGSYLPLSLPLGLAAVLTFSTTPEVTPTAPAATSVGTPAGRPLLRATLRELDTEQRWKLLAKLASWRSDDRPVGLELLQSFGEHLDVEAVLEALARSDSPSPHSLASPFLDAGVSWLDETVGLRPEQGIRLRREWRQVVGHEGVCLTRLASSGSFDPLGTDSPFDRETRAAWRSFRRALAAETAAQQDEAQPLRRAVGEDAVTWATQVLAVLTDEQEQAIRDAVSELVTLPREDRRNRLCELLSGIDEEALQKAVEAIRAAAPEDRPAAVHAAVDVVAMGVLPVLTERFDITPVQQHALERSRDAFFLNSEPDRASLALLREIRRDAAWSQLTTEEQELLTAAAADLCERFQEWCEQMCSD